MSKWRHLSKMHMSMLVKGPAVQTILSTGSCQWYIIQTSSTQLWRYRVNRSSGGGGGLWLLGGNWSEWTLVLTGRIFIPVPVWIVSSHWSNIDPECRVLARCYPMRMKSAKYLYHVEMPNSATRGTAVMPAPSVPAAQTYTKIWRSFLLGGGAARICVKIWIACSHVGQMLFAGYKYLLLKRITVYRYKHAYTRGICKHIACF